MIFSTHVMSEAEKLCDPIGIIHGGKVRAEGTLDRAARPLRPIQPRRNLRASSGDAR